MANTILNLNDISKYYTSGQSVVMGLNSINLSFELGEFVAITGESGSGKSTLAKVLAGILPYESGELYVNGAPTSHYDGADWERYRGRSISFISQNYDILPGCSVLNNVVSALRLVGMTKKQAVPRAEEILRQVELWELKNRRAAKLSSGQKQRLSIARALAKPAPILIADEPTGNLDEENSNKIIELLAAAAKERLVLMVTHDFEGAAEYVSRKITLRDGVVTADVTLRPSQEVAQQLKQVGQKKKGLGLYTAGLQMGSRPVWSTIMMAFFAMSAFAVFAFLGTFIVNLDDSNTRIYDNSAFRNGAKERIVVMRQDGSEMTQEDWDKLLAVENVDSLERYGYVTDMSYFYRRDVDINYDYNGILDSMGATVAVRRDVSLKGSGKFMQTVPLFAEEKEFLTAGRLPKNMYEVVAVGDESLIGELLPMYIQDTKNWGKDYYLNFMVEVVGVTAQGDGLYFSDQMGQIITEYTFCEDDHQMIYLLYRPEYFDDPELLKMAAEASQKGDVLFELPDYYQKELETWVDVKTVQVVDKEGNPLDPIEIENWQTNFLCNQRMFGLALSWVAQMREDLGGMSYIFRNYEVKGYHPSTYQYAITLPDEAFGQFVGESTGDQVTITVADYAYAEQIVEEVNTMGYIAVSPYLLGTTQQNEELAAERMQTLKVCLIALAAAMLLQIVVLRAMFGMENETFRMLADLGLICRAAKRSILWQIILFTIGGQVLASAGVAICWQLNVERIVHILRYLPIPYMLLIAAVHFISCWLTSLWVRSAMGRQVYPATGQKRDLKMDEEVEA